MPRVRVCGGIALFGLALSVMVAGPVGCAPVGVMIGAGAAVGTVALEERGLQQGISDRIAEAAYAKQLADYDLDAFSRISIEVIEGRALLTGIVADQVTRIEAVRLAWQVPDVHEVINEITVGTRPGLDARAADLRITAELRTRMTLDDHIDAVNYALESVDGRLFLFGIARDRDELSRVENYARSVAGVREVISHVIMKDDPARKKARSAPDTSSSLSRRTA